MKQLLFFAFTLISQSLWADTIGQYMAVASNINRIEMKADSESQAWVRSARNVLLLTSESVWESLNAANEGQTNKLFCCPAQESMNAEAMTDLIKNTYNNLTMNEQEKNKLTVAQVGLIALQKKYPCQIQNTSQPNVTIRHRGESPVNKMIHMGKMGALM